MMVYLDFEKPVAALEARIEREFAQITPAAPAPDATPTLEPRDAAHG